MDKKLLAFLLSWFLIAISPVLIIPNHTFTMYLTLSSIGLYAFISYVICNSNRRFFMLTIFFLWIFASISSLSFYKENFWMIKAQETAHKFQFNVKSHFPFLPQESVVLYPLESNAQEQSLQQSHAIQAIFDDPSLTIYYNKESLIEDKEKLGKRPIYIYTGE